MSRGRNRSSRDGEASSEEVELEAAENLLSRLRRQYRMMERNRRQYYDETTVLLTKQRKMLADLEQDKSKLEEELKLSGAPKNKSRDLGARNTMSAILERQEHYETLIEDEKERIKKLDANIATLEKQLREVRKSVPSTKLLEAQVEASKASNVVLENRIQQATVRLNGILAENKKLRNDIENLLKERDKFMLQAKRVEKQLAVTSKKKSEIMDQVTKTYSEREEAQSKMKTLKERINRDTQKHVNEMKKLQRAIDYQTNLRSFVNTIAVGEEEELFKRRQEGEDLDEGGIEMTLENYRSCITHLEEASQESSVENIISNYLQAENDNYTLFSFISDLNNEVTAVAGDVSRLQQEIDEVQGKGFQVEKENSSSLGSLRENMLKLKTNLELLEEQERKTKEALTSINNATSYLFDLLECEKKPVHSLVGSPEVMNSNLSVFLSIIEQKIQEMCQLRDAYSEKDDNSLSSRVGQNANEIEDNAHHSDSSPSSILQEKPAIPHIAHPSEEDSAGPTTHHDIMSSLRLRFSNSLGD